MLTKTLRLAAMAAGLAGALFATSASAADMRLAKPSVAPMAGAELMTKVAMVPAPLKGDSLVETVQRRGGGFRRGGGGGRVIARGGRRRGVGRGVAVGLGAAAALAIIGAAAANANSYPRRGGSCRRWANLCEDGEGWACRRFDRNC